MSLASFSLLLMAAVPQQSSGRINAGLSAPSRPQVAPFFEDETAQRIPATLGTCTYLVEPGDLNGDDAVDLIVAAESGLRLLFNDGTGHFQDLTVGRLAFPATQGVGCVALGDVDGDGDLDLFTGTDGEAGVPDRLWLNRGGLQAGVQGAFTRDTTFPIGTGTGSPTSAASFGDVNGDGLLDLATTKSQGAHGSGAGSANQLYLNMPGMGFEVSLDFRSGPWNLGSLFYSTDGLVLADFDGDQHLDIFYSNSDITSASGLPGQQNQLLLGHGDGTFVDATDQLPLFEDNSSDAVAVDFEGDGDLDIVVANSVLSVPASGSLLLNQGGVQGGVLGEFAVTPDSGLNEPELSSAVRLGVAVADFDLDQDPDLFFSVHALPPGGADHPLMANQLVNPSLGGNDLYERFPWFDPAESISSGAAFFDMENDGDPDLVIVHCGSFGAAAPVIQLFRNLRIR